MIILFFFAMSNLWANDGAYTMSGNQLIPIMEPDISVKKEILTIKRLESGVLDVTVESTNYKTDKISFMFDLEYINGKEIFHDDMSYKILKNASYARRGYRFKKPITYMKMLCLGSVFLWLK